MSEQGLRTNLMVAVFVVLVVASARADDPPQQKPPTTTCASAEQGLRDYIKTRGAWDAIDETETWLAKIRLSCPTEKATELSKVIEDDNALIEKERTRQREAREQDEWAQDRARASAAYKRAELAEQICANFRKVDANRALLSSKTERDVDRATGTKNVDLKRRVAAANLGIEKLIAALKTEYLRYGGAKADVAKGERFWCGYRSVIEVYKEEKARALADAKKSASKTSGGGASTSAGGQELQPGDRWVPRSGPKTSAAALCASSNWPALTGTLKAHCSQTTADKPPTALCNEVLIPAFSKCSAQTDFDGGRGPVEVGTDDEYCVPTLEENGTLPHCVAVKFLKAPDGWLVASISIKALPTADVTACKRHDPESDTCTLEGLRRHYLGGS